MNNKKAIIVGTGFSGAYIGRNLAELGWKIKFIEQRNHIAGNMYDKVDKSTGCLVHEYGPHIFHANDDDIWQWLNKYSKFEPFELSTQVFFETYQDWFTCSFGFHTVEQLFDKKKAEKTIKALKEEFANQETATVYELMNSENEYIKEFADILWEEDYKPYTAKQWGLEPENVDINIFKRVPVYLSYYKRYNKDKYEALPSEGYTKLFENILNHENISIQLETNAIDYIKFENNKVYYDNEEVILIFTGAIDELFNYKYGHLGYRSLVFEKEITLNNKEGKLGTPCVDVYPNHKYPYTRISNYGLLPLQNHLDYQVSIKEFSLEYKVDQDMEKYYPIAIEDNLRILDLYKKEVGLYKNLYLSGRLADYKYYNMDQALIAAREVFEKIIKDHN